MKTHVEIYNEILQKYPKEHSEILQEISCELSYDFVEPCLIKDYGTSQQGTNKCVNYSNIIFKVKWPEGQIKDKLERAQYNETDNPVAFLVAGTVIHVECDDEGDYMVYISDDQRLWNNPDDYDRLVHFNRTRSVQYGIVAHEFFGLAPDKYSIGNLEELRPGKRVMMSVFYLKTSSNDKWLSAAFSDIKYCSENLSLFRLYDNVKLDDQYQMITKDEFYKKFLELAQQNEVIRNSDIFTSEDSDDEDTDSEGCYIATCVYGSYDCPQVWTLRRYRDFTLYETWCGRVFVYIYYAISPWLVKWFGDTQWFQNVWREKLDKIVEQLQKNGVESSPYEDRRW